MAELQAREGRTDAAVAALKKALIEGRPEKPDLYFAVAERLTGWNLLDQARQFAERGVALAGKDLLVRPEDFSGAAAYATILTRVRDYGTGYTRLREAAQAARDQKIEPNLAPCLSAMGSVVKDYYTPEENSAFADFLVNQEREGKRASSMRLSFPWHKPRALRISRHAGGSRRCWPTAGKPLAQAMQSRLALLQKQRMRFNEFGAQLEDYWKVFPNQPGKNFILEKAAESYRAVGNTAAELRVLQEAFEGHGLNGEPLRRYLNLLSKTSPQQLVAIAGGADADRVRDGAATSALSTGKVDLALQAIAARGHRLPPVWTHAFTALVGLYYSDTSPAINSAYQQALDTRTIGDRVTKPPNRDETLAGDIWFYYGGRYGEYLSVAHRGNPEDYLPAALEGTPASSDAYFTLADYYREAGQFDAALEDYAHTLELNSKRADARDRRAQILWKQGKQEDAIKEWSAGFVALRAQEDSRTVPPAFWTDLQATLEHIGERKLFPRLREDAERVVRTYVRRNGFVLALRGLDFRHAGEVRAIGVVELHREIVGTDAGESGREMVDRIVLHRPRAVSAGIRHLEPIVLRELLARLDIEGDPVPARIEFAPAAFIERESRIDEIAAVLGEPFGAVERARRLLAAGERQLERAPRPVVLGPVADQQVDPDGCLGLVVHRTARIEGAVFLDERERIPRPVLALGLHDIDVREQKDRLELRIPARIDGDEAALLGVVGRRERVQVAVRETRRLQPRGHALGGKSAAAGRQTGVRLDELFVQLAETLLARRVVLGRGGAHGKCGNRGRDGEEIFHGELRKRGP